MPFIEQKASKETEVIDGKTVHYIKPEIEVTLTNQETGQEYMSDAESDADVDHPETSTKREHIRRDVHVKVAQVRLGADTGNV